MSIAPELAASIHCERLRAADRTLLLVGAWALLVAATLALRPILPIDETRYLSVAWEMWRRGEFLVPHLNALPYSDKPPLLFWLFHLGWWFFGVGEWWPRLVPSLFSLANLFLTAALARRLWPDRPGVAKAAPWILLGLLLWSVYTTMVMFDMLVTFFVLLALLGLHTARGRGGVLPWLQVGAALGLGMLAKGPVVLMLPLFVAVLAPWWGGGAHGRGAAAGWRWWPGLLGAVALGAALALAWALPAAAAGGATYGKAILFSQTEGRLVDSLAHGRPWWWYLALLPALLYPYSLWAPLWRAGLRQRSADPGVRFTLAWLVPGLVVFSLISGKQPHYLLPLLPAFALLAARLLDEPAPAPRRRHLLAPLGFLFFVGGTMAAAPWAAGWLDLPAWAGSISPGAGFVLLAAGSAFLLVFERLFAGRGAAPSLLTLALVVAAWAGFSEASRQAFDLEALARYLSIAEQQRRPIAYVGDYHGELHFLGRLKRPFREIPLGAERRWLRRHPHGKVVQDLRYIPPEIDRADFIQPYRGDILAVWSRASFVPKEGS